MAIADWRLFLEFGILAAKIGVVIGVVLGLVSYTVLAERKLSAMIQERVGPNRVGFPIFNIGGFLGLGQPIADSLKLLLKEDFTPSHVHKFYFHLAPALAMIPAMICLALIPFGSVLDFRRYAYDLPLLATFAESFCIPVVIANVNAGVLLAFAITSFSSYGIVLAGWSSRSQYPFLGGLRACAQLISYELALGLSVIPVFLIVGSLNLNEITVYQMKNGWLAFPFFAEQWQLKSFVYWVPLAISFVIFLSASFAETNRLPFDLPESETELVGGHHTEYSSMKFALFFLGEYTAMIVASCLVVVLFWGGWSLPGLGFPLVPSGEYNLKFGLLNIMTFGAKLVTFLVFFIWVRWTLPRFRYDQLMNLGWKILLPAALANTLFAGLLVALLN